MACAIISIALNLTNLESKLFELQGLLISIYSPVSPSWAERDLLPLLLSWYKTYRGSLLASTAADFGKRYIELDPDVCEQRGACGFLDLYM